MGNFFRSVKPPVVGMVSAHTQREAIMQTVNSIYDGADAIGVQLCFLKEEYRGEDMLRELFSHAVERPIYVTSYHGHESRDYTVDQCAELLLRAQECGADLLDLPGHFWGVGTNGMTFDAEAVKRQSEFIDDIHRRGGQVLMSCHHSEYLSEDEILRHAYAQAERGADVMKIVAKCTEEEHVFSHINTIHRIKKEIDKPLLFLTGGPRAYAETLRLIGPSLGVCMYLTVAHHDVLSTPLQPKTRTTVRLRDTLFV